jgi:hypothetical protein
VNSLLLFINESIFMAKTPVSLPLQLLISSLKRNLRRGLIVTYLKVRGLGVKLIFNKNIIKLKNDEKYIKKAVYIIVILYIKQGCNCKDNMPRLSWGRLILQTYYDLVFSKTCIGHYY